jgi:hypothetical protein
MDHRFTQMRMYAARSVPLSARSLMAAVTIVLPLRVSSQASPRQIPLGEAFVFRSVILNEDRELLVTLPESYSRTTVKYPVLFVLDGSSNVLHATASVQFLARARNRVPEAIVVAIPNRNRNRDLTPGPGAVTFERVLAEEIIPWVESHYRAAPDRILWGHSLSASFAVHVLLNRPELFKAYIAASAPVWRYENFAADVSAGLPHAARVRAAVYLAVGEYENENLRGGVQRLVDALKAGDSTTVPEWSFSDMKDQDHNSMPLPSLYWALETRYAKWRFPFFETLAELDSLGGLKALENHYQRFSRHFGYAASVPEERLSSVASIYVAADRHAEVLDLAARYAAPYPRSAEAWVNQAGYDLMRRGRMGPAIAAFKKNTERFPESANAYDSLGEAYCRSGDKAAGQRSYQEAARVAAARTPPSPRIAEYQAKAVKGCDR